MVKSVALIKRKPGISRDEFIRHYEEVHVPLILRYVPTIRRYARNHVITVPKHKESEFDCVTEAWFDDMDGYKTAIGVWKTEAGQVIRDDESIFLDRSKLLLYLVEERDSE
jgi:uncharacterized protein (TIGR02118 family)